MPKDTMTSFTIAGARVLTENGIFAETSLTVEGGDIVGLGGASASRRIDAAGMLLLPGIVDIHGDAFERQIMPRPNVRFPLDMALLDTDAQLVANGITTAFHGVTCSWEPGLRGIDTMRDLLDARERLLPRLSCDARIHLRWETYNLADVAELADWIAAGRIGLLAFNDHVADIQKAALKPGGLHSYADRSGLGVDAFADLLTQIAARADEVPSAMARLAAAARDAGIAMLAHDERRPEQRSEHRELGVMISEFPVTRTAALAAWEAGEPIVMGAPNIVRGGSHSGNLVAADYVRDGLCTVLASDYHYPSIRVAPFKLATDGLCSLGDAWALVSTNPAAATGLDDRGVLASGRRADLLLVDTADPALPRPVATWVGGRLVYAAGGLT